MMEKDSGESRVLVDENLGLIKRLKGVQEVNPAEFDKPVTGTADVVVRSPDMTVVKEPEGLQGDIHNEPAISSSQEIISETIEPKKSFWDRLTDTQTIRRTKAWIAAGITALSLSPIMTHAESEPPHTSPGPAIETPAENEATPLITEDYRQQTIEEIMNYATPEPTPIPTEKVRNIYEAWKQETFSPYEQELRELGCENQDRISFCAKILYAWDNSKGLAGWDNGKDKFQNHLSREEIMSYCINGKNEDIFYDKDGKPVVWQVNLTKRMKKAFSAAIDWYEDNGAPDALESLCNNGFCILFTTLTDPDRGPGSVILTEHGIISPNKNAENIKDIPDDKLRNQFIADLFVESYGIAYFQLVKALGLKKSTGYDALGNCEVVKSLMAAYVGESMSSLDDRYKMYTERFIGTAETFANNFGLSTESPWTKRQLELILDFIDPIGFKSLREVKAFNQAIDSPTA